MRHWGGGAWSHALLGMVFSGSVFSRLRRSAMMRGFGRKKIVKRPSSAAHDGHAPPLCSVCLMGMVQFPYVCALYLPFLFKTEPRSGFRHIRVRIFGFGSAFYFFELNIRWIRTCHEFLVFKSGSLTKTVAYMHSWIRLIIIALRIVIWMHNNDYQLTIILFHILIWARLAYKPIKSHKGSCFNVLTTW